MTVKADTDAKHLPHLLKVAAALKDLEAKLDALESEKREPIAIVGMGCRFPGDADSPDSFWRLLKEGGDAVTELPPERLQLDPAGAVHLQDIPRWGAFLKDVERFDADFFRISPREAAQLDPQQRLLLEVTWEALEHAGLVPEQLTQTPTGVFVGITTNDYMLLSSAAGPAAQDAYTGTGNGHCFPAGRISYVFDLEGPSLAVDTACSSSLVAVHLACQSLRSGESKIALAGGVNLALALETTRLIAQLQALSPDGRCKAFDARANGFVRGEGCGIVVLKRLSDAQAHNDRVLAVIRGSAVNQDGRSIGLTAPNLLAQQKLLRRALDNARVSPAALGLIETHGTGTSLGDPIEVVALTEVFGQPRDNGSVCALGAVKTNLGHLEAAAGVAGLIKVVLSLQHDTIPANLHYKTLNPRIALQGTPLVIPAQALPWAAGEGPRLAGVSSFGMSGTNAHIIVEEAPRRTPAARKVEDRGLSLLPLSARSEPALTALARSYLSFLGEGAAAPRDSLQDIAYTASVRRSHHEHRLAVIGRTREQLCELLRAFLSREPKAKPQSRPRTVFVFSGQGSQWTGMGCELLSTQPVFRAAVAECDSLLRQYTAFSVLEALTAADAGSRIHDTAVAQPAIFSIQVGLSALLRSWGIKPDAVIGHSVGEIAAAYVAGILGLADACRLVAVRGRIMQQPTGPGKMAAVALSAKEATEALLGYEERLAVAAINDPASVVLSGEAKALDELLNRLQERGVHCRPLHVNYAFHSPQMAPLAQQLHDALTDLTPRRGVLPMYSTTTGARADGTKLDAAYWARNLREPVQLARAIELAVADRHRLFLEVGPHPVLAGNVRQCLSQWKAEGEVLPTLRRDRDEQESLYQALGALYSGGCEVDFRQLFPEGGQVVSVPTYPWQRQRHWLQLPPAGPVVAAAADSRPEPAQAPESPAAGTGSWMTRLAALAPEAWAVEIEAAVRADVAAVLLLSVPGEVDANRPLRELGMDSLMAVQLRHELAARTGLALPATLAFDYPTVLEITQYLYGILTVLPGEGTVGSPELAAPAPEQ